MIKPTVPVRLKVVRKVLGWLTPARITFTTVRMRQSAEYCGSHSMRLHKQVPCPRKSHPYSPATTPNCLSRRCKLQFYSARQADPRTIYTTGSLWPYYSPDGRLRAQFGKIYFLFVEIPELNPPHNVTSRILSMIN